MRFPRTVVVLAALLACAAAPRLAAAGDKPAPAPSPPAPPSPETADSLYNQGNDAYDRGDYALALELYAGAFKLRRSYDIARNLGLAELKLGKLRDAIGHFTYSLEQYPSNRADTKKQVVEWLAQAKTQVGTLRLTVDPDTAACKLNGAPIPHEERDGDILVDPGETRLECAADGYRTEKRSVTIEKGAAETVTITLARKPKDADPPPPPPRTGYGALPLPARQKLTWAGLGLGAALIAGGAVTAVLSVTKAGEADGLLADLRAQTGRSSPCAAPAAATCGDLLEARKFQDVTGNVAFWTLLAGAGVTAFSAAYLWPSEGLRAPASAPPKPAIGVTLSPGGAVITGSF